MKLSVSCAIAAVLLVNVGIHAQQADRTSGLDERLSRIFASAEFQVPRFGPARWLPDGTAYTTVESGDIVRYDAATGARGVVVAASRLTPPGTSTPLAIDDYTWSRDGQRLLVFTNTRRVWRQNTRGDYWVFDMASGGLRRIGGDAPDASLMFAKFGPDGSRVAYVRANDLYVERLDTGAITRLTTDGSESTINGTSDWVYEEELGLRDGFRWSPDGTRIAYWQFDTTGVGVFTLINNTDTLYPTITRIPYPKVGTTNSAVRAGVVDIATRKTQWLKTPGDPRNSYLARLEWQDAHTLAIQQLNRLQNQNDLLLADARTGDVRHVFRDSSRTWVELMDDVPWIDGGRAFLWLSERDGWQHIYRVSREGGDPKLITRFEGDVIELGGIDESRGLVYFIASPHDATQRYLYRATLDGTGAPQQVTPPSLPGTHAYDIAPRGAFAFHTYSRLEQPPTVRLVTLPDHREVRALTDVSALREKVTSFTGGKPIAELFKVDIGSGVTVDGWMMKPAQFDATRRYPTIVFVYSEPASQTVTDRWGGSRTLFHRALADAGYIIVSVDNRGTPAPKGAAWRKVVYGSVGDLSSKEQDAAIRTLASQHAFIDRERIGVWGWSGGGSATLNAMFRFPETYHVGVAVAPVPDQRLYDTIYQERYMGLPSDNGEGYRLGSPINFADGLKGKLLIVHGTGDDNVHSQGTERLANRLIELGKPFDMMLYPNRTHAIAEGKGTTLHVYRLIARYFLEHLPPGAR